MDNPDQEELTLAELNERLEAAERKITLLVKLNEVMHENVQNLIMHAYVSKGPIFGVPNRNLPS